MSARRAWVRTGTVACLALPPLLACGPQPTAAIRPLVRPAKPLRVPLHPIAPADFQTAVDQGLSDATRRAFENAAYRLLEDSLLRPVHDDAVSQAAAVDGIEVQPGQFVDRPDLNAVADDCARMLGIARPRIYVVSHPEALAYTTRFTDPIIVLSSRLLRRYDDATELRFIVGHEMGHIKASHLRLKLLVDQLARVLTSARVVPDDLALLPLLPALKWSREAEMSADNAGLLCAQDLGASERALVRLLLNLDEATIGRVDVDKYLAQKADLQLSSVSEAWFYVQQISRSHPFVPDRIRQIRAFQQNRYPKLIGG